MASVGSVTGSIGSGVRGAITSSRAHKAAAAVKLHTLSISAPVTRLKWRPPAGTSTAAGRTSAVTGTASAVAGDPASSDPPSPENATVVDRHGAMLAVATAPISGASAGGSGSLGLWSYLHPFLPLSVVEGHREGAVTDFCWLDTPPPVNLPRAPGAKATGEDDAAATAAASGAEHHLSPLSPPRVDQAAALGGAGPKQVRAAEPAGAKGRVASSSILAKRELADRLSRSEHDIPRTSPTGGGTATISPVSVRQEADLLTGGGWIDLSTTVGTWQHVLSVGRDGQCLVQSFARGERPISNVPPSTFAVADLSPFQPGYGSLQIMSVHQDVPSGDRNDFALTGLRRDAVTARAPGVFREVPPADALPPSEPAGAARWACVPRAVGERVPPKDPELVFSVMDRGDLDESGMPVPSPTPAITVAPEVVHLSRFADMYRLRRTPELPTKAALCRHNAAVAGGLLFASHARMWTMLASLLDGAGTDDLDDSAGALSPPMPRNAMAFLVLPTLRSLLLERADAADVQTCVAVCEVMQVIIPPGRTATSGGEGTEGASGQPHVLIPSLDLNLVREWYLAYIEILQQMCLFSHASAVIRGCNDPFIGALNQQSTTVHESCPNCRKPLQGVTTFSETDSDDGHERRVLTAQRACKSCRRRVGLCFLCHEPVKGMFVWCPGCGHGGHLDHAIEWFGGGDDPNSAQEYCPTGCGHKCNLLQHINAFPRTNSLVRCMPSST